MLSLLLAFSFSITGCQGNNSDAASSSTSPVLTGTFIDKTVQGLYYTTATQSGTTTESGEFKYLAGETIEFKLGNLSLGTVSAASLVTPYTLTDNNIIRATNIALMLQNFDNRENSSVINVKNLEDYNFSGFDLSSSNENMEGNISVLLATPNFQTTRGGSDFNLIDTNTTKTAMDTDIQEYENSIITPDLPSDTNTTSDINSLALSISSGQEVILENDVQKVIVTDTTAVSINIKAFNSNGESASKGTIAISYPVSSIDGQPITYLGTITPDTFAISEGGLATFTYTPPTNIEYLKSIGYTTATFILYDTADTTHNVTFNVKFTNVIDPKYTTYKLDVYPENNVTITEDGGSTVLEALLVDTANSNKPVAGENVLVTFFDATKGTLSSFSATTDTNGHIALNYTAPSDITGLAPLTIEMRLEADVSKTDSTTITFSDTAVPKDYSDYTISLVNANRTITQSSQVELFNVYLEDNSSGVVSPAVGDTIVVDFFDGNSGTLNTFSGVTDVNGHVQFTYTAPVDLSDLNGTKITFRVQNTTIVNNYVESTFTVSESSTKLSTLKLAVSKITLSQDAQSESITVLAFNGNGEAYSGGSVSVRYPDEITNGTISGGLFTQSSVEIVDGRAVFEFTGPNPLVSESSLNFDFVYSEDSDKNTTLTVEYIPEIPVIVIDNGNITITKNGEIVTIGLTVYDKDNALYPDGNIKIKYPNEVLTGKNVGSFDASTATVVDGKASFTYTAANPLDGNDSIIFTFYHDSQPILSEKDLNISIVPESGQIVLTNYVLDATYETNMNLDTTKGMTFYIEDENGDKISDSNITFMRVSVLNSALGSLEDTDGNTGSSLSVANTNSVQMNIRSNTISGVIPIEVYSEFKDANNNDKNLTKVFNIVVLSGPPTAMSLSYASTEQDSANAKFIENWVLTVTDEYNNLVNSTPSVSMGAIINYAQSGSATSNVANYLYYDTTTGSGTLSDENPSDDKFTSGLANVFANIDISHDKLVLFGGDGYRFDAFGKWDIANSNLLNELELVDDYNGSDISDLGYAVGNNFRNEVCSGSSVVANVYAKDGNNTLGTTGSMIIQVEYDYYLTGKSIVLWSNLVGSSNDSDVRIGIGKKVTLRGEGLTSSSYSYAAGFSGVVRIDVSIDKTVEFYKNANFGYRVEVSGTDTNWTIAGDSMSNGNITDCTLNSGVGYVDVNITTPASASGTIELTNLLPSSEF